MAEETDEQDEALESLQLALESLGDASRELLLVAIFLGEEDPVGHDALVLSEAVEAEVAGVCAVLDRVQRRGREM